MLRRKILRLLSATTSQPIDYGKDHLESCDGCDGEYGIHRTHVISTAMKYGLVCLPWYKVIFAYVFSFFCGIVIGVKVF